MEIRQQLVGRTARLLSLFFGPADDQVYESWNAWAIAMLERLDVPHSAHVRAALSLTGVHRAHANRLMQNGESDRARRELVAVLKLVRSVSVADRGCPVFVLDEALTLAALGQWSGEFTLARSPLRSHPGIVEIDYLEMGLAELTARRIGWLPTIVKSPGLLQKHLTTEAWADRVIAAIQSDAAGFELDRARVPAIALLMPEHIARTLSRYRAVGKLDDAQPLVDQLVALAKRLSQSYPDQAAPYMLLSDGYEQRAKNAWQGPGEPVIEWERKSLDAAKHAASLDPQNDEAHNFVKRRFVRVNKLSSK
jgi:hypothetical protein